MDLIESEASKNEVTSFVSSSALSLLGKEAKVFALSARMAKQAKDSSAGTTGQIWNESGFAPLENFINETLDSIERLRLKLRASSSVGKTITEKYLSVLSANLAIVKSDLLAVQDIQRILKRHESIVRKAYPAHLACVDNVLMGVTERAGIFFDTNVRLSNILNLSNKEVIEQSFEEEVLKGTSKSLQRQIQGVADWLADMSSKCLTESTAVFSRRVGERAKEVAGLHSDGNLDISISSLGSFGFPTGMENDVSGGRGRLAARLADVGEELSGEYISQKEGKRISDKITASVRLSAGLGIGSIASLAAFLMNSSSFSPAILLGDPTIPLLVSIVIGSGAAVIPRQRRALKCELKARIDSVRRRLQSELRGRLEQQLTSHVSGIRETIQPFSDACDEQRQDLHVQMSSLSECLEMVCKLEENMQKAEICVVDKT